jgi:histidine triad (HIT) family protein
MDNCIFCKIIKGEIPAYKIAENDKFLAFLDICQMVPGHTLIIPKKHYQFIWDVPNIDEYSKFVQKVGEHYRDLGYEYVDSITMGRGVPHSHIHLIPHNADENDWHEALKPIFKLQLDEDRRPSSPELLSIQKKFQIG